MTETKTLFGAYDPCTYGTAADRRTSEDLPFGYQESVWTRFDFGGDAGKGGLVHMGNLRFPMFYSVVTGNSKCVNV